MIAIDGQLVADAQSLGMTRREALWLSERNYALALKEIDPRTGLHTVVGEHDLERSDYWERLAFKLPADD